MSIQPYKNRKGEIVPDAWELCWYEYQGEGKPKKERKKVVKNTTLGNATLIYHALLRSSPDIEVIHDPTFSDKWYEWLKHYARDTSEGTLVDVQYASQRLLPFFGEWHLSRLRLPLFEQYMDKRLADTWRPPIKKLDPKKTYSPAWHTSKRRINTELKYAKLYLDWCVGMHYMSPLTFQIPKFRKLPKRTASIPSVTEVNNLLKQCRTQTRLAVLLYHDAGLRKNEALHLQVNDVMLDDELLHVIGKGDKERYVAIATTRLREALEERLKKVKTGLLICHPKTGEPYKDLRKSIEGAADRAGIRKNIYNHLFRHTYISRSHEAGVPLPEIQEQAGHADIKTTRGYIHLSTQKRIQRAKLLDSYLLEEAASQSARQKPNNNK